MGLSPFSLFYGDLSGQGKKGRGSLRSEPQNESELQDVLDGNYRLTELQPSAAKLP